MLTATPITDEQAEALLPLADVKLRLRITTDALDADLRRARVSAIRHVETYSSKALIRRQWVQTDRQFCHAMKLFMGPAPDVEGVAYRDSAGALVELDEADWHVGGGVLHPAHGTRWPYASGVADAVQITYLAGFATPADVEPELINAVLVGIAGIHASPEAPDWGPAEACADQYRSMAL